MPNLKSPLLSLGAHGTIGEALTFQSRRGATIARQKPIPTDPYSLAQAYQRWDYKDYAYLWTLLSNAEKQVYRTRASKYHITGFSQWMRENLKTLPYLAGRWHLDEASGAIAYDTSKNANNATIIGATPAPGLIAGGLYFDGLNDQLTIPDDPTVVMLEPFTMSCFAFANALQDRAFMMKPFDNTFRRCNYALQINNNHKLQAGFGDGVDYRIKQTTAVIPAGWRHFAAVITSKTDIKLYIDGVEWAGVYAGDADTLTDIPGDLIIGRYAAWWYKGWLDELILSPEPLDQPTIKRMSERRYSV